MRPSLAIVSYLTPITGIAAGDVDDSAITLAEALVLVYAELGPDVLLVGQAIQGDAKWLQLEAGVHYHSLHDLSETFKAFNPKYGNHSFFSLQHEATTLLGPATMSEGAHDPCQDALVSIQLYKKYVAAPNSNEAVRAAHKKLISTRVAPSVAKRLNYTHEGVCMAKFMQSMCKCGQPTGASA